MKTSILPGFAFRRHLAAIVLLTAVLFAPMALLRATPVSPWTIQQGAPSGLTTASPLLPVNSTAYALLPKIYRLAQAGDELVLTAKVTFRFAEAPGGGQFRFGLFSPIGDDIADTRDWAGYTIIAGGTRRAASHEIWSRTGGGWAGGKGAVKLGTKATVRNLDALYEKNDTVIYTLTLTLKKTGRGTFVTWTLKDAANDDTAYSVEQGVIDTAETPPSIFDRVAFTAANGLRGSVQLADVDVTFTSAAPSL
ncbi:hypothetical protein OPIT5_13805 [Opitutaceae bacterium TAV5]|nr:hypothetical protein OPIT5_13805 [Opitutaceae bacterium TAV5]